MGETNKQKQLKKKHRDKTLFNTTITIRRRQRLRPKIKLNSLDHKMEARKRARKSGKSKARRRKVLPSTRNSPEFIKLVKFIFGPIVATMNDGTLETSINKIFSVKYRDVILGVASSDFTMPGLVWGLNSGDMRFPLTSESKIKKGIPLIVRIDEAMPDRIDIERADKNIVFSLTNQEYSLIYKHINEVYGCDTRLEPPKTTISHKTSLDWI